MGFELAYNPEGVKIWANSVINYLNGDSESIGSCAKRFGVQIEKLVQPNVWTGPSAAANYKNFLETHQALVNFVNNFGTTFQEIMLRVNNFISGLETSNLGTDTAALKNFGNLQYDQIASLAEQYVGVETIGYSYTVIQEIGSELGKISQDLENINTNLNSKINELNNNSGETWDGSAAETAKQELSSCLQNNMSKVISALNQCIKNINDAAANALAANTASM